MPCAIFRAPQEQPPTSLRMHECISPLIQDDWWRYPHVHASFSNIPDFLPHPVTSHIGFPPHCVLVLILYFMLVYRHRCDAQTVLSVPLINSDFPYIIEQLSSISRHHLPNTLIRVICTHMDPLTCCNIMSCCYFTWRAGTDMDVYSFINWYILFENQLFPRKAVIHLGQDPTLFSNTQSHPGAI